MTAGRIHVFAGPSVPHARVRELLPSALVHGPIAHGDILRIAPSSADTVAIVDGVFMQSAAVRHKELLHVMERGVAVWGAGSMGALRGAELHAFGMRTVGLVADLYRIGVLNRDDEVAVMHRSADEEYRPLSDALVSVRVAARRARRRGLIGAAVERQLVETAAGLYFPERRYETIVALAVARGADAGECEAFAAGGADPSGDVKRQDAELLLRRLGSEPDQRPDGRVRCPRTVHLAHWLHSAASGEPPTAGVGDEQALAFCQLFAHDYAAFHRRLALRAIVGSPQLDGDPLETAAIEVAQGRGVLPSPLRITPQLRAWLTADEERRSPREIAPLVLARSFRQSPGVVATDLALAELAPLPGFQAAREQVARALALNRGLAARNSDHVPRRVSEQRVRRWFAERWGVGDASRTFDAAVLERGFVSRAHFLRHARPLLPFAILRGVPTWALSAAEGVPDA